MSWKDLLVNPTTVGGSTQVKVLPWCGGKQVSDSTQTWTIAGKRPLEHGWYEFNVSGGREARLVSKTETEPDVTFAEGFPAKSLVKGYLVGDRLISDTARVDPDPTRLIEQTESVFCVERGLERFTRAVAVRSRDESGLVYVRQEFPEGPEFEVQAAYQDRKSDLSHIAGVTPALDAAFRWVSYQRIRAEQLEVEQEALRIEEARLFELRLKEMAEKERVEQLMKDAGNAVGRRALAAKDFRLAAREALRVSGAELLDVRESARKGEMVVQYRFRERRLECVVAQLTLRVIDAGVCLEDHRGTKGDTWLTLESLPGVIGEAIRLHKLVVYRDLDYGRHYAEDDRDDDEDY